MRKGLFVGLFGFLLIMLAFVAMTTSVLVAGLTAQVLDQRGEVLVQRASKGEWRQLASGGEMAARLKVNDQVRTGADGFLALQWADGTRMEIDPETHLTIRKYQFDRADLRQVSLFRLDLGTVFVRVSHALVGDSRFEIETPSTTAAVRGTIFAVTVSAEATRVQVLDGEVALAAPSGGYQVGAATAAVAGGGEIVTSALDDSQREAFTRREIMLPTVRIKPFLKGAVTDGEGTLRGQAEPGATVTIDGAAAPLDATGTFAVKVPVKSGANRYQIVVTDAAGHTRELVHQLDF